MNKAEQLNGWGDLAQRLQQMTREHQGAAVVRLTVLVNRGTPQWWLVPDVRTIEPKAGADAFCEWFAAALSA